MDITTVKIERTYIALAHIRKIGAVSHISRLWRADLPENCIGAGACEDPEALAFQVISELQESGFLTENLAVYLGGGTELFSEYRFSENLTTSARKRRRKQIEGDFLAGAPAHVYHIRDFRYDGTDDGLAAHTILAADSGFCDRFISVLARNGYSVKLISSSLAAFAETAKTTAGLGDRVLVVCAEKREMKAALFIKGRLTRLARFAQGTSGKKPAAPLLPFITKETKIALCGFESQDARFRAVLRQTGALAVGSVNFDMQSIRARINMSEELADRKELFPGVFSAAAFPGEEGETAYYAEDRDNKKIGAGIRTVCIAMLAAAVFACAVPPATLFLSERERDTNRARLSEPLYEDAAAKLASYRTLVAEHTELLGTEEAVPTRDPSYANLVEELKTGLLLTARIDEIYYEKGKGILVDFTTGDVETYDELKNIMIEKNRLTFYETKQREEAGDEGWRIQIRVYPAPSAAEAQR